MAERCAVTSNGVGWTISNGPPANGDRFGLHCVDYDATAHAEAQRGALTRG
jgi:hypothetical protein